ncbi:MAG: hypothetical protein JSU96_10330 [Acidobacteriota bacterium]|nr:MAG: hypothetical protein JSU96_10330 [Acidobacteriota bacterium]
MKRLSWVVAGVVTVLLVLVAGILLQMPAPEELGQVLMNRLSSAADVEFSAEVFESEIFGALTARNVKTSGTFRGGRFDATIGEMIFDFDLQSKLLGQPVLKGIHLREPRLTLTLADKVTDTAAAGDSSLPDDSENLALAGDQPETVHFLVELGELRVLEELTDGSMIDRLTLLDIGAAFDGINLNDTGNSVIRRITASGILEAKSVQLSALVFDRVYSEFQLQSGIIKSTELRLFSELGTLQTSILLDLAQLPIEYEFTIEGEGLEAGVLLGQDPGGPAGEASLTLQGEGKGLSRERFSATGTLDLSGGALPPHPVLNDVAAVLNLAPPGRS